MPHPTGVGPRRPVRSRRSRQLLLVPVYLVALLASAAGACQSDGKEEPGTGTVPPADLSNANVVENDDPPQRGGKVVYGLIAETNGWNPGSSQWASSGQQVARSIFDTLSAYDADSNIHPFLAERFDHNAEYTEWRIVLRSGVRLHNGKEVTAETVKRNQEYLKASPLTATVYRAIKGFRTEGPLTVVVELTDPWVNYPYALASQIGVVGDPDWMESRNTQNPIGTGPFKIDEWVPDKEMRLSRNADYWRPGLPLLDELEYKPIPDDTARSAALESGAIDIMQAGSGRLVRKYAETASTGTYQVFNAVSGESSEVFVMLNTLQPPLDDVDARRALAHATNPAAYNEAINEGYFQVATGPFAPTSKWYTPTDYPAYDPVKAAELIEKVKAKNGGQFTVTLLGSAVPQTVEGLAQIKQQWEELGITVEIKTMDQLSLIVQIISGQYQGTLWQQFDAPHPLADSIWWHPESAYPLGSQETSLNFARNEDPEIGKALDQARHDPDTEVEKEQYRIVQRRLAADVPYIWLYHTQLSVVAQANLVNVTNAELPDGAKQLPIQGGAHPVAQMWRRL